MNLVPSLGALPVARQWPNYPQFINTTNNVSDIHQLKLTWSMQRDDTGNVVSSQNQLKKSASGTLTFEGQAYDLIKQWLINDVSASLNSIEVKIEEVGCGTFEGYIIKSQDINWCEGGVCEYQLILKQQDEAYNCLKRTLITDNWQGWYQKVPSGGKKHPRFSYCNEIRPNSSIVMQWYITIVIFTTFLMFLIPMLLVINSILWILNAIKNILGTSWNIPSTINMNNIMDGLSTLFVESAGCGREHPASLMRDYISNVCDRCGIIVNANTAPIFFAPNITINTSTGVETGANEYYNLAYVNIPVKRGLRRFRKMSLAYGFQDPNDEYWIPDNDPLHTLDTLLDEVLPNFNHEWKVKNGQLIIKRKDEMNTQGYIYDFRDGSADRSKVVEGICFEPKGDKFPAYCTGIYIPDGADSCGNEAGNVNGAGHMNGIVPFVATTGNNGLPINPNFEGVLNKSTKAGAAKFRFDGTSGDYISDALQVIINGNGFNINPFAALSVIQIVADNIAEYADNVLLLQSETAIQPKLLIWDGLSYENARAIKTKACWPGAAPQPIPDINNYYNPNSIPWNARHYPDTSVLGQSLTFPASPNGIYRVEDTLGILSIIDKSAILMNFPMFFEPFYKGTLWDRFHWIDDPNRNPVMNYTFRVKIRLCCEDVQKLGLLNMASGIVLNERVKLPFGFNQEGVIKEITISYDPSDELGRWIELRGEL